MRQMLAILVLLGAFASPGAAQSVDDLRGTWSGDWNRTEGPGDRVTIEFRRGEDPGALTGRLLNPVQLDLTRVELDEAAGTFVAEAVDPASSTTYLLEGSFEEELTRVRGTMSAGSHRGEVKLVKWTYVPRPR